MTDGQGAGGIWESSIPDTRRPSRSMDSFLSLLFLLG